MNQNNQHTGLTSRLNAWLLHIGEERYNQRVDKRKQQLFDHLSGSVRESGPGTGTNLAYYPEEISLTELEPNPYMQGYPKEKSGEVGKPVEIITGTAEDIPLDDESMNAVVSTLMLCSVNDQEQVLREIRQILKPGGRFLFLEHVAAPNGLRRNDHRKLT